MDTPILRVPVGYEQVAPTTAKGLTLPTGAGGKDLGINFAVISVSVQPVRYRDDGTAPDGTHGVLLPVGTIFQYSGDLTKIQFIQTASGAILDVAYYRAPSA